MWSGMQLDSLLDMQNSAASNAHVRFMCSLWRALVAVRICSGYMNEINLKVSHVLKG